LDLADGARVIVRPSGTEPKVKAYLEVVVDDVPAGGIGATRAAADGRLAELATAIEATLRG
ncbi:MAG: phospho-sugar mutase, partial [Actinomycetota bacterium]